METHDVWPGAARLSALLGHHLNQVCTQYIHLYTYKYVNIYRDKEIYTVAAHDGWPGAAWPPAVLGHHLNQVCISPAVKICTYTHACIHTYVCMYR